MSTALPSLQFRCLGPLAVRVGDADPAPDVLWRKHLALLIYLALSPDQTRARSHLTGLLWAESPDEKARRSLNEAVYRLRLALGDERLLTNGDAITLNPQQLDVDVTRFESLHRNGDFGALELLRGDFLEGFHVDDAPAFDAWMERERAQVRDTATRLLVERAEEQLSVNRCVEARALSRRALGFSPYSEVAVSIGMRAAALEGDVGGALALYREFAERLAGDLGERPSAECHALAERVREGRWRRPRGRFAEAEPPLVGRRAEHAEVFAALERVAQGGAACVVLVGEPGSGRTRLLHGCAERLALAGATVVVARILEGDHDAPWSTLRTVMREGLIKAPGLAATDPVALRVLASIVPELSIRVAPIGAADVAQVSAAVGSMLRALAEEQPVAVLIDDAQWADGSTLAAFRSAWSQPSQLAAALVLSVQSGSEFSPELRALLAGIHRDIPGAQVRLPPLTEDELVALVEALAPWCTASEERARLCRRVAHESGGNPFLAVTLLRELRHGGTPEHGPAWPRPGATYESTLPITIPGVVRTAMVARVARLDPDTTAVLRTASVAGELLDPPLIAEVTGLTATRVETALEELERQRFVLFDGGRYVFNGRLVPAVIERECMQPGGRRRIRDLYVKALASRADLSSQWLRARLLGVDHQEEAFDAAVRVAQQAAAAGAARTAQAAVRAAERSVGGDESRRAALNALRDRLVSTSTDQP